MTPRSLRRPEDGARKRKSDTSPHVPSGPTGHVSKRLRDHRRRPQPVQARGDREVPMLFAPGLETSRNVDSDGYTPGGITDYLPQSLDCESLEQQMHDAQMSAMWLQLGLDDGCAFMQCQVATQAPSDMQLRANGGPWNFPLCDRSLDIGHSHAADGRSGFGLGSPSDICVVPDNKYSFPSMNTETSPFADAPATLAHHKWQHFNDLSDDLLVVDITNNVEVNGLFGDNLMACGLSSPTSLKPVAAAASPTIEDEGAVFTSTPESGDSFLNFAPSSTASMLRGPLIFDAKPTRTKKPGTPTEVTADKAAEINRTSSENAHVTTPTSVNRAKEGNDDAKNSDGKRDETDHSEESPRPIAKARSAPVDTVTGSRCGLEIVAKPEVAGQVHVTDDSQNIRPDAEAIGGVFHEPETTFQEPWLHSSRFMSPLTEVTNSPVKSPSPNMADMKSPLAASPRSLRHAFGSHALALAQQHATNPRKWQQLFPRAVLA